MEEHHDLMSRMRRDLYGNGRPGLIKEHDKMRRQQDQIVRDLYRNPDTGDEGVVANVRYMRADMQRAVAWIRGGIVVISLLIAAATWAITTFL